MSLHVNGVEAFYVLINLIAMALTVGSLTNALGTRRIILELNGRAREIAATANVRREALRLTQLVFLLALAIPSLAADNEIPLDNPFVLAFLGISVSLALISVSDWQARRTAIAEIKRKAGSMPHP